jgi:L-alanine-DL-glutamate epimerase-like enolase superfamily enzyme
MSRIANISVHTHCNDIGGRVWNPAIRWTKKYAVFVVIEGNAGQTGLGECWCFDTKPDTLVTFLSTEVIPHFLGAQLSDVPSIIERLTLAATLTARHGILASALSAVDIAAWDLRAKNLGRPLWTALNPEGSGQATLYASGGLYAEGKSNSALAEEFASFADKGFRLHKMKVGGAPVEEDVKRIEAVLAVLPKGTSLIIDGVYSFTIDTAREIYEKLPTDRIAAFQSPLRASNLDGMRMLGRAGIPVMATEAEYRREIHDVLIHDVGVAFLQTAPIACGGITRLQALCAATDGTDTHVSLEVSSTAVALMAACHLAAAHDQIAHVEYHSLHDVFFDRLDLDWGVTPNGTVALSREAGLGILLERENPDITIHARHTTCHQEPRDAAH